MQSHSSPSHTYAPSIAPSQHYIPASVHHQIPPASVTHSIGGHPLTEEIKYVEVPVVQEVIRQVPKREVVEVEKRVPVIDYQYVDKVVEVPQINYVDKIVEVPQIQEVVRRVPVPEIIEIPREIIKHVPKIETKVVEKIVEVPGEIIEVPKPYQVENKIVVPSYVKKEVPTVVSQKLIPTISESAKDVMEVTVNEYVPKMVPVDVFVPKPISRHLIAKKKQTSHSIVDVPAAQWNTLVLNANPHIVNESDLKDILITQNDVVPTLNGPGTQIVPPAEELACLENRQEAERFQIRVTDESQAAAFAHLQQVTPATYLTQVPSSPMPVQSQTASILTTTQNTPQPLSSNLSPGYSTHSVLQQSFRSNTIPARYTTPSPYQQQVYNGPTYKVVPQQTGHVQYQTASYTHPNYPLRV